MSDNKKIFDLMTKFFSDQPLTKNVKPTFNMLELYIIYKKEHLKYNNAYIEDKNSMNNDMFYILEKAVRLNDISKIFCDEVFCIKFSYNKNINDNANIYNNAQIAMNNKDDTLLKIYFLGYYEIPYGNEKIKFSIIIHKQVEYISNGIFNVENNNVVKLYKSISNTIEIFAKKNKIITDIGYDNIVRDGDKYKLIVVFNVIEKGTELTNYYNNNFVVSPYFFSNKIKTCVINPEYKEHNFNMLAIYGTIAIILKEVPKSKYFTYFSLLLTIIHIYIANIDTIAIYSYPIDTIAVSPIDKSAMIKTDNECDIKINFIQQINEKKITFKEDFGEQIEKLKLIDFENFMQKFFTKNKFKNDSQDESIWVDFDSKMENLIDGINLSIK